MSFRTVMITKHCKCSYKNEYLVVYGDEANMLHLSEIQTVIFDSTAVSVTAHLICELARRKINVIFCDEKHNPISEMQPIYGSFNTSKKIKQQVSWSESTMGEVWKLIIKEKIKKQAWVLEYFSIEAHKKLNEYSEEVLCGDSTNREGHAAKVYFNSFFGKNFGRNQECEINSALNYGYAILLSAFNREIISNGYITQLGINHKNEYNEFNLSCDLMEPFRPFIDKIVYDNIPFEFNSEMKIKLVDSLNLKVKYDECNHFLSTVISKYTQNILKCITENMPNKIEFCESYEG